MVGTLLENNHDLVRLKTHHVLVYELDDRLLHVKAGVLGESLGNNQHRLRIRLDTQLRAALNSRLEILEAAPGGRARERARKVKRRGREDG